MEFVSLLAPVEGEQPSGVELRNDGRFHAIERLLEASADPFHEASRNAKLPVECIQVFRTHESSPVAQPRSLCSRAAAVQ